MTIKVGDRVRYIGDYFPGFGRFEGTVVEIDEPPYPNHVRFDFRGPKTWPLSDEELEVIGD